MEGQRVLEIGCSTGFVLGRYSIGRRGLFVGIDIKLGALLKSKAWRNIEVVNADGHHLPFRPNSFDLIFFNPPYLPSDEVNDVTIDGGREGIEVTLGFLKSSKEVLKSTGLVVFICSSLSNIEKLEGEVKELGFKIVRKEQRNFFFERLFGYYLSVDFD